MAKPLTMDDLRLKRHLPKGPGILAKRIIEERSRLRMSQRELGDVAGLHLGMVSRIESGEVTNPQVGTLAKLAEVMGVSLDYLLGRTDVRQPYPPRQEQRKRA